MLKTILIFTFSMSNNGAERVFCELANEFSRKGNTVKVIECENNAYGSSSFKLNNDVELITLGEEKKKRHTKIQKIFKYIKYLKMIISYCNKYKTASIIAYSFTLQVLVFLAHPFIKNKIIFSERNDPNSCPYSRFQRFIRNFSFRCADKVIFQTEDAKSYFPKTIQKKGEIICNPINPLLPKPFCGNREKKIITASRLRPQKNLLLLINSFEIFHREFNDYSLEIYGIGELKDELQKIINEKKLGDFIKLKGFCEDINNVMNKSEIYACSSDYEGISNSMLEAIAMGIPTISTDCPIGGARLIIENGKNGLLVPVGDVFEFYKALKKLASDDELRKKISKNGIKLRESLSVDKIAEKWITII